MRGPTRGTPAVLPLVLFVVLTGCGSEAAAARWPRPGLAGHGGPARRRGRGGQHHGHSGAGTADRDRVAALVGATRRQIRTQFLAESLLLSAFGGAGGALLGGAVTAGYSAFQGWPTVIPALAMLCGAVATLAIGGLAALYPAIRASRLSPTEALATP